MAGHRDSKISQPRAPRIVHRPRVTRLIARQLTTAACWLAAPAGSGKTTAVLDFLHNARRPVVWYRVDEGDRDIAGFFHYLSLAAPTPRRAAPLPVFGSEYANQSLEFARRFFRAWFARLRDGTTWVIDDLHYADDPEFRRVLAVALEELPASVRCIAVSRGAPFAELDGLRLRGQLSVLDHATLSFSDREARTLVRQRAPRAKVRAADTALAGGWAAGLVLVGERLANAAPDDRPEVLATELRTVVFDIFARQLFSTLSRVEQDLLIRLSLPAEVTTSFAVALTGKQEAAVLLAALHRRQIFVTRRAGVEHAFRFHDLFRDFLQMELQKTLAAPELKRLRSRAAELLAASGQWDEAVELAIAAGDWRLACRQMLDCAAPVLRAGKRATFSAWCERLPASVLATEPWLNYWLGVAHLSDDALAEELFETAFGAFDRAGNRRGAYLTAIQAVLSKTDSWRTHTGLERWTLRVLGFLGQDISELSESELALGWSGTLRAMEFSQNFTVSSPLLERLLARMSEWLEEPRPGQDVNLRLSVSQSLIEYAGTDGKRALFERAVDSVLTDVRHPGAAPWHLGLWLVSFGAMSGRYFPYRRRDFPYADARAALQAAADIGARERLRSVEFGALYHLQLLAKLDGQLEEFGSLVDRLAGIADSRYTTQVAIVADCQAARLTLDGTPEAAHPFCARFNAAIEAANEPPVERWPHYVTEYQVLLAANRYAEARSLLQRVLPQFDGEVRRRTEVCIAIATALEQRGASGYTEYLRAALDGLVGCDYYAALLNLPDRLAGLCADGLDAGIQTEFCRRAIRRRRLAPQRHSLHWPWVMTVQVLGAFDVRLEGRPVDLGTKAPRKSIDILKLIATARDHAIALDSLYDTLWPDADGAQAKAACDQALHRLRRWLGRDDLVLQRESQLRFDSRLVGVDLAAWEDQVKTLRTPPVGQPAVRSGQLDGALERFPGPLLAGDVERLHLAKQALRIEREYLAITSELVALHRRQVAKDPPIERIRSRALQHFPHTESRLFAE